MKTLTKLQQDINNCNSIEEITPILENCEPLQDNGHKTSFSRKMNDALWYDFKSFEDLKKWCINVCIGYNK